MDHDTLPLPCHALVCGDSIAAGIVFDEKSGRYIKEDHGFVRILQQHWNGTITNLGRFGNTIGRALPRLRREISKHKPDIVFIELGGNDCDFKWREIAASPYAEHTPSTPVEQFEELLLETVQKLQAQSIHTVLSTLPPIDADRYFAHISEGKAEMAEPILKWLGSISRIYWWHERYNAAILRVVRQTGAFWVDLRSAFLRDADYRSLICRDGIHPTRKGQELIARTFELELNAHCPGVLTTPLEVS